MASSEIKIDFYQFVPEEGQSGFSELVRSVQDKNAAEKIKKVSHGVYVRLQKVYRDRSLVEGDLVRIRMDLLPVRAKVKNEALKSLELDDDEGIGEQTAFLFDPANNVLLFQRSKSGVSLHTFAAYLESKCELAAGSIAFRPIIKHEAMKKLARIQNVRSVDISLAVPADSAESHKDQSVFGFLGTMAYLKAPKLRMSLSAGRWSPFSLDNAKEFVTRLFSKASKMGELEKVEVTGTVDDRREILDLIEDRLTVTAAVDPDRNRRLKYQTRRAALFSAWNEQQDELKHYVTSD